MSNIRYDYKNEDMADIICRKKETAIQRRKRNFTPIIFFALEVGSFWLFMSLFNYTLNIKEWFLISIFIFIGFTLKSIYKTLNIYERQKNYPTVKEAQKA